jgi:hypothetical protein
MSALEVLILLALAAYAIYRQTRRNEVVGSSRFKLALIYVGVGVGVGGFSRPDSTAELLLLVAGLALGGR